MQVLFVSTVPNNNLILVPFVDSPSLIGHLEISFVAIPFVLIQDVAFQGVAYQEILPFWDAYQDALENDLTDPLDIDDALKDDQDDVHNDHAYLDAFVASYEGDNCDGDGVETVAYAS